MKTRPKDTISHPKGRKRILELFQFSGVGGDCSGKLFLKHVYVSVCVWGAIYL